MIVKEHANILKAWKTTGKKFLIFFLFGLFVQILEHQYAVDMYHISISSIAIIGTGVSIFLGFRINSAYARWWEARKIWGGIVNDSRHFGSALANLMPNVNQDEQASSLKKEIIYNLLGFINVLRLHLRRQGEEAWQNEVWDYEINGHRYFSDEESTYLKTQANIPTQTLHLIMEKITKAFTNAPEKEYQYIYITHVLRAFFDHMGKCERIKNTVFPWGYDFYTKRFVWLLAFLIPLGILNDLNVYDLLLCSTASTLFVTIEQVGHNLDSPFENSFNDTPMSTICRNIEIDLLQQMDEPTVPAALQPVDGLLW